MCTSETPQSNVVTLHNRTFQTSHLFFSGETFLFIVISIKVIVSMLKFVIETCFVAIVSLMSCTNAKYLQIIANCSRYNYS